jgi:3-deoxy-manno-octulosonate cytidylyltransferase (CMP-KDO synthetase)
MELTPLEIDESVDMMRIFENGLKVEIVPTKSQIQLINTEEDLAKLENLMDKKND